MPLKLTPSQASKVYTLARDQCCNCDDGNCLLLNGPCVQLLSVSSVLCRYFKEYVLPSAPKLHKEILSQNQED